jgi:hypothetical protein
MGVERMYMVGWLIITVPLSVATVVLRRALHKGRPRRLRRHLETVYREK